MSVAERIPNFTFSQAIGALRAHAVQNAGLAAERRISIHYATQSGLVWSI